MQSAFVKTKANATGKSSSGVGKRIATPVTRNGILARVRNASSITWPNCDRVRRDLMLFYLEITQRLLLILCLRFVLI